MHKIDSSYSYRLEWLFVLICSAKLYIFRRNNKILLEKITNYNIFELFYKNKCRY